MKDFKGKVAVITAAASGIGRGIAGCCAQKGIERAVSMFRKTLLAAWVGAMLVLSSGVMPVFAKESTTTFEKVFTLPGSTALLFVIQPFQSSLYISSSDSVNGGQIWRSKDGNSWTPVTGPGYGINPNYVNNWGMTVFKGKIYTAVNCDVNSSPGCPGIILRSANGKDWEQIPLATGSSLLDKLGVFEDMIYATSVGSSIGSGGYIWRSRSGDPGTWQVVEALEAGVNSSSMPTEYNGQVYISGSSGGPSVFFWHSADGRHWDMNTLKITNQDTSNTNVSDSMLSVFKGNLYFSTFNDPDGGAIYRSKDGKYWETVLPGNPVAWGMADMIEYRGALYVTSNYSVDDNHWGARLLRSRSGNPGTWEPVNPNPSNWGEFFICVRGGMALYNGSLYIADTLGGGLYRMEMP